MHNLESFKSSPCKQVAKAQMGLHGEIDSLRLSKLKKTPDVSWHYFINQVDFSLIHCVCRIFFDKIVLSV